MEEQLHAILNSEEVEMVHCQQGGISMHNRGGDICIVKMGE